MAVKHYRELIAWQKAMDLVVSVYKLTASFPREELYGLTSQLRRSAVSVPSNIAEGQGRQSTQDFLRFLAIAQGSLQELETQILIAQRLDYFHHPGALEVMQLTDEVGRLLRGLSNALSG